MSIWIATYNHFNYKTELGIRAKTFDEAYVQALKHVRPACDQKEYKSCAIIGLRLEREAI